MKKTDTQELPNPDFYKSVGLSIQIARKRKGLTQEALATLIGLSRATLANIESGRQKIMLDKFVAISKFLETPIQNLLPHTKISVTTSELDTRLPKNLDDEKRNWITQTIVNSQS